MGTLNKTVLVGRLGKDPEARQTPAGIPVTMLSLATNNHYKDKEGHPVKETDWHRIVTWRKLAEICGQHLKKGSLVCVEGQLKTRSYTDGAGIKRYVTEVLADSMQILGPKRPIRASSDALSESPEVEETGDGLPF